MDYPLNELIDMIYVLGETGKNPLLAQRIYRMKYPERRIPTAVGFRNVMDRFDSSGSVKYSKREVVNKKAANEDNELEILLNIQENPQVGSRTLATLCNTSKSTVNRTTNKYKYHPYHIELHQELREEDFERRIQFCNIITQQLQVNNNFLCNVLFSDEATFKSNGAVNRHNMHYYATENPFWVREIKNQNHWSVNAWCGILHNQIIGPYFFDEPLSGRSYLYFLREEMPQLLEDINLNERLNMWLQHDGAPPHFHCEVRQFLYRQYPEKWIGRGGFISWPPRSCDLTPLDFFLWGYIKDRVYVNKPTTREDMKDRIREVCRTVTPLMLSDVRHNIQKRINMCIQQEGRLFEHLLRRNIE